MHKRGDEVSHPALSELFPYIDHLMMDFKHPKADSHKDILGVAIENVIHNISLAAKMRQCALRIPLINGYNTSDECIDAFVSYVASLEKSEQFTLELIVYHEYGKVKWEKCGKTYSVVDGFVSSEKLAEIISKFKSYGITPIKT